MAKPKAVLVVSGKGGVGKTLIAVNLALQLKDAGVTVGLLDADFSASNTGYFLDLPDTQMALEREQFIPVQHDGLELFSIPLIGIGNKTVNMEGDQYSQILRDAANATTWQSEYLIVDCPAGWGDEIKTAAKVLADSLLGSVIIIQPAHVLDGKKAIELHKDLEMPILGLIENMTCMKVGKVSWKIFGESVVDQLGQQYGVPIFGKIPLSMQIRKQVEAKNPKLTGEYAEPIKAAVKSIMEAKPQKPGFIEKMKKWFEDQVVKLVVGITVALNEEIDILNIQRAYGYPGGRIIRLNIMQEDMETLIKCVDWLIIDGKLTAIKEPPETITPDMQIDIVPQAFKWAILGNKQTADGHFYTFQDAQRLGHMKIYGDRSMAMAAYFMQTVFLALAQNERALARVRPILEVF
jgi:ATP-binding protein involved in chromosome partitioning